MIWAYGQMTYETKRKKEHNTLMYASTTAPIARGKKASTSTLVMFPNPARYLLHL